MTLLQTAIELLGKLTLGRRLAEADDPHETPRASRICRVEPMEPRRLLAADIQVGAVYIEEDTGSDVSGDTFEVTFEGGAPGTQLRQVIIDGDRNGNGLFDEGDVFFDLVDSGVGIPSSQPFRVVTEGAVGDVTLTSFQVFDGSTQVVLNFEGFEAGEKFVFSLDVDEVNDLRISIADITAIDAATIAEVNDGVDSITSGVEFQRSQLHVRFTAPHYRDVAGSGEFRNRYDGLLTGRGLNLSPDNANGKENRTAGAATSLTQQPLPVTISGRVFLDNNLDLTQDAGEVPLAGVPLSLWRLEGSDYVATGHTTTTNVAGDYVFGESLNLLPGTYQVRETQPSSFGGKPLFSVGAIAGTVAGAPVGSVPAGDPDTLTDIEIPLGDQHAIHYDFAEAQAAELSGYVYHDRNDDGQRASGEEGIAGVSVRIEPVSTIAPATSVTVVTNALGFYRFVGLPPGQYHVVEVAQPSGWLDGRDTAGTVDGQTRGTAISILDRIGDVVLAGGSVGVEYNFGELLTVEIHGNVHLSTEDGDCFGTGASHEPLAGVRVLLFEAQGKGIVLWQADQAKTTPLAETTTDAQGNYAFTGLRPGIYTVVEVTPVGLFDGGERAGTVGGSTRGTVTNDQISNIALQSGEIGVGFDFCEHEPASISGLVYHDANNDGIRNATEAPIAGVRVILRNAQGIAVGSPQFTDAGGAYQFSQLTAGQYTIQETQPDGWLDGRDTAGTITGSVVGVAINPGDEIRQIAIGWGQDGVNYNFGELAPVSLSGYVYHDRDDDGSRDAGEEGLGGVTVQVVAASTLLPQSNVSVVTDAAGFYQVSGLSPGTYHIVEVQQPSGWLDGQDAAGTVSGQIRGVANSVRDRIDSIALASGESGVEYNFGELLPVEIRGNVHLSDEDGDCFGAEVSHEPLAGVRVLLFEQQDSGSSLAQSIVATGNPLAETTTDAQGNYRFSGLRPGRYTVVEVTPDGLFDGGERAGRVGGSTRGVVSDDRISGIVLQSGQIAVDYDFCEHEPSTISGSVYHDANNDGLRDASESPIAGVTVVLRDEQGATVGGSQVTDSSGRYQFTGLAAGTYAVQELQPSGWLDGKDTAGTIVGSPVGVAINPGDEIRQIDLGWGQSGVEYNFGELAPVSISGYVFHDRNDDGNRDAGEEGIAGVKVQVVAASTLLPQSNISVVTDANGFYRVIGLSPGTYNVVEVQQPSGWLDGQDTVGRVGGQVRGVVPGSGDRFNSVSLASGEAGIEYNFGELLPVEIHGNVHLSTEDGDCFGIDVSHGPLAGVRVLLLDADGNPLGDTLTDEHGDYEFTGLRPGNYSVFETTPVGLADGGEQVGTVQGSSRGSVVSNDTIGGIVLTSGEVAVNYDFCEHPLSSLSGFVYHDANNDGVRQSTESPIAAVDVHLIDADTGNILDTQTTATDGSYQFAALSAGNYRIVQSQPTGWLDGLDAAGTIGGVTVGAAVNPGDAIGAGSSGWGQEGVNYNFGELLPVEIHGDVHLSTRDGDCFGEDVQHEPLVGVSVMLLDADGRLVDETTTDQQGRYAFVGLVPGEYSVVEITPQGLFDGSEHVGTVAGDAIGAVVGNDEIGRIVLGSGQVAVDYDFCEHVGAELSGFVYHDVNNNGRRDSNESPIANVAVDLVLDETNLVVVRQRTDASGFYRFSNVSAGTYHVVQSHPSGWIDGRDAAGTIDGSIVGAATNPGDRISGVTLTWGDVGVDYNFGELLPGRISGTVFQDGPAIQLVDGSIPDGAIDSRDGRRTSDDSPIAGVTLRLTNFAGEPILDTAGNPRTAITDRSGFYEFSGLPAGSYAVFEVHPGAYLDGIDTAGSTGGVAVNPGANINPLILAALTVDPKNDAILRIPLAAGALSSGNDFSEILIDPVVPPVSEPPATRPPPTPPPILPVFVPQVPRLAFLRPVITTPDLLLTRSGVSGYTWHLSVINGGQPRSMRRGNRFRFHNTGVQLDVAAWGHSKVDGSEWTLADREGKVLSRHRFGRRHAFGVTGDWNGDGTTDLGIFIDGQWFIDMNGNGVWDAGDLWVKLGHDGDLPVTGDWDGDGKIDVAVFGPAWAGDPRAVAAEPGLPDVANERTKGMKNVPPRDEEATLGRRHLKLTSTGALRTDVIDHVFHFGTAGDRPVAGDWNGDGVKTIGVYRNGTWHLDVDGDGRWSAGDVVAQFGSSQSVPVVGDWNGNGIDQLGVFENGKWTLDTNADRRIDAADQVFTLGGPHHQPVVGDWDGDGADEVGVFRDAPEE